MLRSISIEKQTIPSTWFHKFDYLIGEFDMKLYKYTSNFWVNIGKGISIIKLSDKLIEEKIKICKGHDSIVINNTFGFDSEENYKMTSLNLSSGEMDLYNGEFQGEKLVFKNSNSPSKQTNGDITLSFTYKLIYNELSENENEVVVGKSENNGKTWVPYLKSLYKRK